MKNFLKALHLFWIESGLWIFVLLGAILAAATPVHCEEDYFQYSFSAANLPRKAFVHFGGSMVFTGTVYAATGDRLGSIAIGLIPGAAVEIDQMVEDKEKLFPNAMGDFFLWDLSGAVSATFLDDLFHFDLRPKIFGVHVTIHI